MIRSAQTYKEAQRALAQLEQAMQALSRPVETATSTVERVKHVRRKIAELHRELERFELLQSGEVEAALGSLVVTLDQLPTVLVAARLAAGLSITELAARLDVKPSVIIRSEANGYRKIEVDRAKRILDACGANITCHFGLATRATPAPQLPGTQAESLVRAAQKCSELGKTNLALSHAKSGIGLAISMGNDCALADLLMVKTQVAFVRSQLKDALNSVRAAVDASERTKDIKRTAAALNAYGAILKELGHSKDAQEAYGRAIEAARNVNDKRVLGMSIANQAALMMELGNRTDAEPLFLEALKIQKLVGDERGEAITLGNLAILVRERTPERALPLYERAIQLHQKCGNEYGLCVSRMNKVSFGVERGELHGAQEEFRQLALLAKRIGAKEQEGTALAELARLHHLIGNLRKADKLYARALNILERSSEPRIGALARGNRAGLLRALGRLDEAEREYRAAVKMFRVLHDKDNERFYMSELKTLHRSAPRHFGLNPARLPAPLRLAALQAIRKRVPLR